MLQEGRMRQRPPLLRAPDARDRSQVRHKGSQALQVGLDSHSQKRQIKEEGLLRKIAVIGLIVLGLGALAVIVPASASQTKPNQVGRALRPGATTKGLAPQAPGDAFTSNDDFATRTINHFGNPANGSVVGESWIETGLDVAGTPTNIQAFARTILLP